MYKLGIITQEEVLEGFKLMDWEVFLVKEELSLESIYKEILEKKIVICLVEEKIYIEFKNFFQREIFKREKLPIFLPFSLKEGIKPAERIINQLRRKTLEV